MQGKAQVISVQSRKGGVGKTTAALSLAKLLLSEGKGVLLIDLDITGTNVTHTLESPYWNRVAEAAKVKKRGRHEGVDLLALFEEYVAGKGVPGFSVGEPRVGSIFYHDNICVLGSLIDLQAHHNQPRDRFTRQPSFLFDYSTAASLMAFIKTLASQFVEAIGSSPEYSEAVVILDNASGYAGLLPFIEDWVTDMGPLTGKFLTVSSLDKQDLRASANSIARIERLMHKKIITSQQLIEMLGDEGEEAVVPKKEPADSRFLARLLDGSTVDRRNEILGIPFFADPKEKLLEQAMNTPQMYQSIVVNRVPRSVLTGEYQHASTDTSEEAAEVTSHAVRTLLGAELTVSQDRMVGYSEETSFQFSLSDIRRSAPSGLRVALQGVRDAEERLRELRKDEHGKGAGVSELHWADQLVPRLRDAA